MLKHIEVDPDDFKPCVRIIDTKDFGMELLVLDSWDEVNEFLGRIRTAAKEVFGPDYSDPSYDT